MNIYRSNTVQEIRTYYGSSLIPTSEDSVHSYLDRLAHLLHVGLKNHKTSLYTQINNYHSDFLGEPIDKLMQFTFDIEQCRRCIAHEYGFGLWTNVEALPEVALNLEFEDCVNSLLQGDKVKSEALLDHNPALVSARSQFGHEATLLHYLSSNGVELWRQQVPLNLDKIIKLLIKKGANKEALMKVYGGEFTAFELYTTSVHPAAAGLDPKIAQSLKP